MKDQLPSALERVWEARRQISEECHGRVDELVDYYRREQGRFPNLASLEDIEEAARNEGVALHDGSAAAVPRREEGDPVAAEVRRIRRKMTEELGNDAEKYIEILTHEQERLRAEGKTRFLKMLEEESQAE